MAKNKKQLKNSYHRREVTYTPRFMYVPMNRATQEIPTHKTPKTHDTLDTGPNPIKKVFNRAKHAFRGATLESMKNRAKKAINKAVFWWKQQDSSYRWKWRAANGLAAVLILSSVLTPVLLEVQKGRGYQLSQATLDLVGKTDSKLTSKLTYEAKTKTYQFNKESVKEFNPVEQLKQQVGTPQQDDKDKALYSLDVPQDPKKGVTYYDTNSQLSFKLIPQFGSRSGKLQQQRLVYPLGNNTQAVYTLKNNGLKEDIVVQKATEDTMRFSYTLQLPKTLEAKAMDDGSGNIGIYAGNPSLYANMSYGSDKDKELVEKARENSIKDTLAFGIPAPIIATSKGDDASKVKSRFELKDNTLTVIAENLTSLKQPFSIDPSVVITSTSDFQTNGNNEGNITFGSGQISRGALSGGTVGSWTTQTAPPNSGTCGFASVHGSGIHNEYLYVMGQDCIMWAKLNTNGTINGSWTTTTGFTRAAYSGFVYNGYIYLVGGNSPDTDTTAYAKLNANGSIGSFTAGPNLTVTNTGSQLRTAVYNGYAYALGGGSGLFTYTDRIEKAAINPDGSLGAWSATTPMPFATIQQSVNAYNGYMYLTRGNSGGGLDVYYAPIASNGDIGAWVATTSLPSDNLASRLSGSVIYRGYWYLIGGLDQALGTEKTVRYAQINANGSIGSWQLTNDLLVSGSHSVAEVYGDHIFAVIVDGTNAIESAPINPAGVLRGGTWSTGSSVVSAANSYGRASIIVNGFIYFTGGLKVNGAALTEVQYAPINADGSLGAWATTTSMNTGRLWHGIATYDGWLYVSGGDSTCTIGVTCTANNTTAYARICDGVITTNGCNGLANGAVGTWTAGPNMSAGTRYLHGMTARNGYLYIAGSGNTPTNSSSSGGVTEYAQINSSTHAIGTWATTGSSVGNQAISLESYGNRVYLVNVGTGVAQTADINSDGTLGSWNDGNAANMQVAPGSTADVVFAKGYLYVMYASGSGIEYAKINSDGTVGSWTTTTTPSATGEGLATAFATNGNAVYNINFGGTTQYQFINNGGSGDVLGAWDNTSPSMGAREHFTAITYNGKMYALGGIDGSGAASPAAIYTSIGSNGVLGSWTGVGNYPTMYTHEAFVMHNGYVYKLGGGDNSQFNNQTYYAAICTGINTTVQFGANQSITDTGDCTGSSTPGTFSAWNSGATLNTARRQFGAVAYNGYIYALGGCASEGGLPAQCNSHLNSIEVAQIDANTGAPGTWTTLAGSEFSTGRYQHEVTSYNDYVYVLGGCADDNGSDNCGNALSDVQFAKLNGATLASDAGCGAKWCKSYSLPHTLREFAATTYNGYLYATGGKSSTTGAIDMVYSAAISQAGYLGPWTKITTNFTTARRMNAATIYAGNLYVMGGTNASGLTTYGDVQFAGLNTIARKGLYSKLLTFNYGTSLRQITYNGSLANGISDITYRGSSSGTSWTGSVVNASNLTNARCPSPANNRYLQLMVTLDDTQRGVFPDESANAANLTDLTLSYEFGRPPNMRLKLGKILQENIGQTDLDICKLVAQ